MLYMIQFIFWIFIVLGVYVYFGYPFSMFLISFCKEQSYIKGAFVPKVSHLTIAYNEERWIRKKVKNALSLEYPKDKLELVFVSDGSTDLTNSIISEYQNKGINFLRFNRRRGKASCLNDAIAAATGEIIVLTDANVIFHKDAIKKLVRNFKDERLGGVVGEVRYSFDAASLNRGEGFFSKYERFIQKCENKVYSLVGVDGAMYAFRKELYLKPYIGILDSRDWHHFYYHSGYLDQFVDIVIETLKDKEFMQLIMKKSREEGLGDIFSNEMLQTKIVENLQKATDKKTFNRMFKEFKRIIIN